MSNPTPLTSKSKRKRGPITLPGQLDLFSAPLPQAPKPAPFVAKAKPAKRDAKVQAHKPAPPSPTSPPPQTKPMAPVASPSPPSTDEWWTTRMVCMFLKISRKTLWERRRDKALSFPAPLHLGSARNLYRASAVRAWAERVATLSVRG
jgi:predicted DNA-binding transcriptional regulator AlpA